MRAPVRASVLRHFGFSGCLDAVGCPFGAVTRRCDPYLVVTGKSGGTATLRCPFWRRRDLPGDANTVRELPRIDCSPERDRNLSYFFGTSKSYYDYSDFRFLFFFRCVVFVFLRVDVCAQACV